VVENRPGADGIVGITAFLAGSPDDHVLLFAPTGTFTAHPFLHGNLSYNPDQLVPIARVTNTLIAVTVRQLLTSTPWRPDVVHSITAWPISLGKRD
jgi:tripartite-type tricarboxylate transporter receptor subunit TctC